MAKEQGQQDPLRIVHTLGITPGVKRDGTTFETVEFTDVEWCRFQRGVPKKIGGYTRSFQTPSGVPRQLITQSINGVNYVSVGHAGGIDVFTAGTNQAVGTGPYPAVFSNNYGVQRVATNPSTTSFTVAGNLTGEFVTGQKIVFTDTNTAPQYTISSATVSGTSPNQTTTVVYAPASSTPPTQVWVVTSALMTDARRTWQFDVQFNQNRSALQLLAFGGLNLQTIDAAYPQPIYSGDILPDASGNWTMTPISDTEGQNPTGKLITVDGGVLSMYPFIVAYGSNGLIINNHVSQISATSRTFNDWNGPFANINNVAAGKIVRGYPVRGGTASPSGLFWATESLVRMSFNAGAAAGNYWQYDLIAGRISIMSENAVVQMDGLYFWMGIDRFYVYNGNVQVLPNNKNSNYLFDNLNYEQRQKVWATTVPRYNEIWWFYPRGTNTECTDAIIYNVQDRIWYDSGEAIGARRTCGYTTETYNKPFWAGWEPSSTYLQDGTIATTPSGQPAPTTTTFYLEGDQTATFSPGNYVSLRNTTPDTVVKIVSALFTFSPNNTTFVTLASPIAAAPLPVGTTIYPTNATGYAIWEQETGVDRVEGTQVSSVYSSFQTNDIGWVGGGPSRDTPQGADANMRVVRLEPNFRQTGPMRLSFYGKAYPSQGAESISEIFDFDSTTPYLTIRNVEYAVLRLKFESDVIGGDYEMGRLLLSLNYGANRRAG